MHILLMAISFLMMPALPEAKSDAPQLYLVQKIYVGELGTTDEAARFRLLLEEELTKKGFTSVSKPENADAILTGVLSLRVYANTSVARATVRLRTTSDDLVWSGDFEPKSAAFKRVKDTAKFRAQNIADKLRDDWKKSAKAAGIKVK